MKVGNLGTKVSLTQLLPSLNDARGPNSDGSYDLFCPCQEGTSRSMRKLKLWDHGFNCVKCGAHGNLDDFVKHMSATGLNNPTANPRGNNALPPARPTARRPIARSGESLLPSAV